MEIIIACSWIDISNENHPVQSLIIHPAWNGLVRLFVRSAPRHGQDM